MLKQANGRFKEALLFMYDMHRGQTRKIFNVPFYIHLLDVDSILAKNGAQEYLLSAGALHDTVEESKYTGVTKDDLLRLFGRQVTDLVMAVTEEDKSLPWKERKAAALHKLKGANRDVQMLKCADKLANTRDMIDGLRTEGDRIWTYFNAGKEQQKEHMYAVLKAFDQIDDLPMYRQYKEALWQLFG
ncbi:MAG: HD domain-containing protein [Candidatus Aenigmatarchaeota archaeon]